MHQQFLLALPAELAYGLQPKKISADANASQRLAGMAKRLHGLDAHGNISQGLLELGEKDAGIAREGRHQLVRRGLGEIHHQLRGKQHGFGPDFMASRPSMFPHWGFSSDPT
ncbi:hypothetical protein [Thiomonas sp.]